MKIILHEDLAEIDERNKKKISLKMLFLLWIVDCEDILVFWILYRIVKTAIWKV